MAIKFISYNWAIGGVRRLNTDTGCSSRSFKYSWSQAPDKGWAWKICGKWFYSYEYNGEWYLQHKKMIFEQNGKYDFKVTQLNKRTRKLTIFEQSHLIFEFKYRFKGYWFSKIDPTYDYLDAESDDPFLLLINSG